MSALFLLGKYGVGHNLVTVLNYWAILATSLTSTPTRPPATRSKSDVKPGISGMTAACFALHCGDGVSPFEYVAGIGFAIEHNTRVFALNPCCLHPETNNNIT
jgi:hypothetical protein